MQQVKGAAHKLYSMSQAQTEKTSGKRLLEVDVEPAPGGAIATLILPFGLALPKGVKLQMDADAPGPARQFATCLPVGCVVRERIDGKRLAALKAGKAPKLETVAATGKPADFTVPLRGFGNAPARMAELLN